MYSQAQRAPFHIDLTLVRSAVARMIDLCRGEALVGADLRGLPDYLLRDIGFEPAAFDGAENETGLIGLVHVGWAPRRLGGRAD